MYRNQVFVDDGVCPCVRVLSVFSCFLVAFLYLDSGLGEGRVKVAPYNPVHGEEMTLRIDLWLKSQLIPREQGPAVALETPPPAKDNQGTISATGVDGVDRGPFFRGGSPEEKEARRRHSLPLPAKRAWFLDYLAMTVLTLLRFLKDSHSQREQRLNQGSDCVCTSAQATIPMILVFDPPPYAISMFCQSFEEERSLIRA